ncbi:MAG: enoyl-CoA hydratase/isomerase family protein [Pseudomonadota bacterium]
MLDETCLLESLENNVLTLTMNRMARHHALNADLIGALGNAIDRAERDDEIKVVVLTGAGEKSFCAGADMLEASGIENPDAPNTSISASKLQERFLHSPVPIIAAINGYCYGGGAWLAIACDIRFGGSNATFRLPGCEYGLVVAAATLPRLVGSAKAKEWIYSARKFDAEEAFEFGLLNSVHKPENLMSATYELAQQIAANSAPAVRECKRIINMASLSDEAAAQEVASNEILRGSPEQVERFVAATKKVTGR